MEWFHPRYGAPLTPLANRPGHSTNVEFAKKIKQYIKKNKHLKNVPIVTTYKLYVPIHLSFGSSISLLKLFRNETTSSLVTSLKYFFVFLENRFKLSIITFWVLLARLVSVFLASI